MACRPAIHGSQLLPPCNLMIRVCFNRITSAITPWPRDDDQDVVGLDRSLYHVLEVIREPIPSDFDPATHAAQQLLPVIEIADSEAATNGTVTHGWEVVALPSPVVPPDWPAFRLALFTENGYVDAHALALKSDDNRILFAANVLAGTLRDFQVTGDHSEYLQALLLTISALPPTGQAALAEEFIGLAQRCQLPAAFITAFQQAIIPPGNSE